MNRPILITGLVPGYPTKNKSLKISKTLIKSGADILELSASFSEPIADGPTLQFAHSKVLESKMSKNEAFNLYKKIKKVKNSPLFLIEYANVIYRIGIDTYYKKACKAGINYILIPDVPIEESRPYVLSAKKHNISQIFMITPTTPKTRIIKIIQNIKQAESKQKDTKIKTFIYLVSVTGVTGKRKNIKKETLSFIKRVRKLTDMPIIVGFGISSKEHIKKVHLSGADGVVICSAIVDIINKNPHNPEKEIQKYIKSLL